jgi:tRNA-dihydrouridine synthase
LIGRGTLGRPWFFRHKESVRREAAQAVNGTSDMQSPEARLSIMLQHARAFEILFGAERFPRMRKHLAWYCTGFPHAAAMRARMVRTASSRDVEAIVHEWRGETSSMLSAACG